MVDGDRKKGSSLKGYILVDTKKCQGGMTCMLACSWVQEGEENRSLSRIQVLQDPLELFPHDPTSERLKTCDFCLETPFWKERGGPEGRQACVVACPVSAIKFMKDLLMGAEMLGTLLTSEERDGRKLDTQQIEEG